MTVIDDPLAVAPGAEDGGGVLGLPAASLPVAAAGGSRAASLRWVADRAERMRPMGTSLALVGCVVAVWCIERAFVGRVYSGRTIGYLAFGALPNASVAGRGDPGQWWRYVSNALVHDRAEATDLWVNSALLLVLGPLTERIYGRLVLLATLAATAAAGGLAWVTWSFLGLAAEPGYTAGASAAVCGLVGLLLVYPLRHRGEVSRLMLRTIRVEATVTITLVSLVALWVPNLNNAAHAGGLAGGALLAFLVPALPVAGGRRLRPRELAALAAVLAVSAASVAMAAHNLGHRLLLF